MPSAAALDDSSGDKTEESHGPHQMHASPPRQAPVAPGGDGAAEQAGILSSRAYQLEMFDQSLKQNVIVVMDTGSGKTQVAVLRIRAELERASADKIIWFLAPTVSLSAQQFDFISLQIASTNIKLLTGNDNVHMWSVMTWKKVLHGVRIVVSTYQVLLDALCHAFVSMDRLALIVFDEAHNCVDRHPGSKIMSDFYHERRSRGGDKPSILGLTATPSVRSKIQNIETLEAILDAKCVSPTIHREELLKCVKKPQICHVAYGYPHATQFTESMRSLQSAYLNLDINDDPYVLMLQAEPNDRNIRALQKAFEKNSTYSQGQIKGLLSRCVEVCQQVGPWAADLYLWKASQMYQSRLKREDDLLNSWTNKEMQYVACFLRGVAPQRPPSMPQSDLDISKKALVLLQQLMSIEGPVHGIIFVKERATVLMLRELLASCPPIAEKYHIGCVVGESNYKGSKRALFEPFADTDQTALQKFRTGAVSLLIATSVLEEGIDIPACNLIVCFDYPDTPKAFIQRRGRARMRDSKLILLTERSSNVLTQWLALEEELKQVYEDEERQVRKLELLEQSEPTGETYFEVPSTGARLDFDNAKQHLAHFCGVLEQMEYVDSRPDYILHRHWDTTPSRLSATVLLPSFLPEELRRIKSDSTWRSEKNATKAVAFQAYMALYGAGLVNENLLPHSFDDIAGIEARESIVDVEPPFVPWHLVAKEWQAQGQKWVYSLSYHDEHDVQTDYEIVIPVELDLIRPITLFLDHQETCQVRFGSRRPVSEEEAASLADDTSTLLALPFAHRWPVEDKHHVIRVVAKGAEMSRDRIGSARFDPQSEDHKSGQYLVRDASGHPLVCIGMTPARPPIEQVQHAFVDYGLAPRNEPYLVLRKLTRRSDFLHRLPADDSGTTVTGRYPYVLPQTWAAADDIPAKYAWFGMMIPSVIHELEVMLAARELATTLLRDVGISDLGLVREAMSARAAREPVNYERLEFLGDSVLKYYTAVQMAADHPRWPEGYLSLFRHRVIANSRLSRAAIESGLSKFILTRPFTGQKWRPLYLDDFLQGGHEPGKSAKLSTKTLADVVEALIGASYVDGGITKAIACISTFLDDCQWRDVDGCRDQLLGLARANDELPSDLELLEELVGYSFRTKSLLIEAVTHGSCASESGRRSFDRLEFLGDSILDYIIVTRLFAVKPPLSYFEMHLFKNAMVNGDFLAFVVLENRLRRSEAVVTEDLEVVNRDMKLPLWKFMRHTSLVIGLEQRATVQRHEALRHEIRAAMEGGTRFPWALLARLQAKKFYSDLLEALLGAVWLDSGSLDVCEALLARFGMLPLLDRLLEDKVNVEHPKQELTRWTDRKAITYETDVGQSGDGDVRYSCRVLVGDRAVAEVADGVSKEEATTRAAQVAIELLQMEKEAARDGSG